VGDQTRRPPDPISIGSFDSLPAARKEPQGDTLVGREFDGRYLSEKPIGRGGMGNVYRAMQKAFGRPVALKILRPELIKSSRAVKRFERESRIIMKLEHPNSIRLYDFGQAERRPASSSLRWSCSLERA
jgi:serine/threonine protein kinase